MTATRTWIAAAVLCFAIVVPSAAMAQSPTPTPTATVTSTPSPTPTATPIVPPGTLTVDRLRNATYPSEYSPSKQVSLVDGKVEWNQPPLRGTAVFVDAKIGPNFAAVLIGSNTGGSGSFLDLHLVTSSAGTPTAGPGVFIGDRTRAESFVIEGDHVKLSLLTQGPTDPQCCPTQRETRDYIREGGTFRLVTTAITQPGTGAITPPKTGNAGLAEREAAGLTLIATVLLAVFVVGVARRQTRSARR